MAQGHALEAGFREVGLKGRGEGDGGRARLRAWLGNLRVPYMTEPPVLLFPRRSFVRTLLTVQDPASERCPVPS